MSYVSRKIEHLKRLGLVANNSTGIGFNGGACPDWLRDEQKKIRERAAAAQPVPPASTFRLPADLLALASPALLRDAAADATELHALNAALVNAAA